MRVSQNRGPLFGVGLKGKLEETGAIQGGVAYFKTHEDPCILPAFWFPALSVPFKGSKWLKWLKWYPKNIIWQPGVGPKKRFSKWFPLGNGNMD